jgi:heme/copper-type cytochrome/quinol oxidase subunit 4
MVWHLNEWIPMHHWKCSDLFCTSFVVLNMILYSAWVLCKLLICLKGGADMWNLTCLYLTRSTGEDQSWKVFFFYFILFHFLTPLFGKIEVVEPAKLKSNCPVNAV